MEIRVKQVGELIIKVDFSFTGKQKLSRAVSFFPEGMIIMKNEK